MELGSVSFAGKTGIITGAAQGIGKAIAKGFVQMGGKAVIVDINPETAAKTCEELGNAVYYTVDLGNPDEVVRVFQQIVEEQGRVEVLINNAGIVNTSDFDKLTLAEWNRVIAVDLTAVFLTSQVLFRHMEADRRGADRERGVHRRQGGRRIPGHDGVRGGQGRRDLPDEEHRQGGLLQEHLLQQPVPRLHQDAAGLDPDRGEGAEGAGGHVPPPRGGTGRGGQRRAVPGL